MRLIRFLKTTIVGGIVILVPVVLLGLLLKKVLGYAQRLAQPLANHLPLDTAIGIVVADILIVVALALVCFVAGLIAKSRMATRMVERAESRFLWNVPGYLQVKAVIDSLNPDSELASIRAVLCRAGDRWQFGYELERAPDGRVVVFLPGAPNPWAGTVFVVDPDGLRPLEAPVVQVARCLRRLGRGGAQLLPRT